MRSGAIREIRLVPNCSRPILISAAICLASCPIAAAANGSEPSAATELPRPQAVTDLALPNAFRLCPEVYSGGQPEGDAGFARLAALGVKTVISVDGARPDIATAARHGLRYVHLPHGYDGIPSDRGVQLAKALRELPGPVYIHCHHGKHRSPAAAAVACVGVGFIDNKTANAFLKQAGTNPLPRTLSVGRPGEPDRRCPVGSVGLRLSGRCTTAADGRSHGRAGAHGRSSAGISRRRLADRSSDVRTAGGT